MVIISIIIVIINRCMAVIIKLHHAYHYHM